MYSKKELIGLVRDDVIGVATKLNKEATYPSDTISKVLYLYQQGIVNDEMISAKNNPLGLTNPENGEPMEFTTIEQCLLVAEDRPFENDDYDNKKVGICKGNNLYNIDKAYLASKIDNIIDVPEEKTTPKVDQYTVKSSKDEIVAKTDSIKEAKDIQEKNPKSKIYNSRGAVVESVHSYNVPNAKSHTLVAGSAVTCTKVHLYKNYNSPTPSRLITGTFYLYDGKNYAGKVAICRDVASAGSKNRSDIYGFINRSDITNA